MLLHLNQQKHIDTESKPYFYSSPTFNAVFAAPNGHQLSYRFIANKTQSRQMPSKNRAMKFVSKN